MAAALGGRVLDGPARPGRRPVLGVVPAAGSVEDAPAVPDLPLARGEPDAVRPTLTSDTASLVVSCG
jgi:hypothetical protein